MVAVLPINKKYKNPLKVDSNFLLPSSATGTMSLRMKIFFGITMMVSLITTDVFAQAYGGGWGSGMWGGANSCPYQIDVGDEATSIKDDISEAQEQPVYGSFPRPHHED